MIPPVEKLARLDPRTVVGVPAGELHTLAIAIEQLRAQVQRAERATEHEREIARAHWRELWTAVNDAAPAPDYYLINQSDLICAIQDSDSADQLRDRALLTMNPEDHQ